jgi:phage shock protein PspC (stress-responsive transcriptional regulator)
MRPEWLNNNRKDVTTFAVIVLGIVACLMVYIICWLIKH